MSPLWRRHQGTIGGVLVGSAMCMFVEIAKQGGTSPVVLAVAVAELLLGAVLVVGHERRSR